MVFSVSLWVGFLLFISAALAFDLGILNKKAHAPTTQEAAGLTLGWFVTSMLFCMGIYQYAGAQLASEFLAGYLVELSLSVDNVFVIALIFTHFKVPLQYQHRVLFWGVLGAIVMRLVMIVMGVYIVQRFQFIFYIFGILLIFSAYKIITVNEQGVELEDSKIMHIIRRYFRITKTYHQDKFVIIEKGKRAITPLFIVLLLIEKADLIFAIDSIPAILAITQNTFIVFTSNILAILGLRSLYFLLAGIMDKFVYLRYGLGIILGYIGAKMLLMMQGYHLSLVLSLGVIIAALGISIAASLIKTAGKKLDAK